MRGLIGDLFAGKLRIALVVVLALAVGVGGAFAIGILGVPSVADIDNTFGEVTEETTTIETDLVISNPNPFGVDFDGVSVNYTVSMNSIEMAHGNRQGIAIESGNSTIPLETQLQNDVIPPWWATHIRNGERTEVVIDATVSSDRFGRSTDFSRTREIETDLIGAFNSEETRPVNADSALTDDPVLYVNETRGEWGTVSDSETPIDMAFTVYNPNLEPYAISEIGYNITMNDIDVGDGRTREEYVIPSHSTETIELSTAIDNSKLDEWWVSHLDEATNGHQVSELRIEFYAVIEFPSGEEITVPLDELTYEETVETDIFGEGDDGDGADDSDTDGGDSSGNDDGSTDDGATDDGSTDDGSTDDGSTDDGSGDGNETDGGDDDGTLPL